MIFYFWQMDLMHTVVILQGTNLGDRQRNLEFSESCISEKIGSVISSSSIYETAPWGKTDQSSFLNRILLVKTVLKPERVLETLLAIESMMGRERLEKWEPRIIDLDIIFFDDMVYKSDDLELPHPYIQQRRFTLEPLNELMPFFVHPVFKVTVAELLASCKDVSAVKRLIPNGQPL